MSYIDEQYYTDEYKGRDAGDELGIFIQRASELIDQVTGYKLYGKDLEEQPAFIQEQVKKAVAAQVEFYVMSGGYEEVDTGTDEIVDASVGSFSYQIGRTPGQGLGSQQMRRVSPTVIKHLEPTGLLYTGLGC